MGNAPQHDGRRERGAARSDVRRDSGGDGTNFHTFIDTFNTRCAIARRGKNKQGRNNLRQVSYALFCCADGQLPLYYEVNEGNRNDFWACRKQQKTLF